MIVLGISAYYHDSAAAIVRDGAVVAAAQEERFTRKKNDSDFPERAIAYCLEEAGVGLDGVDFVSFYEKPILTFNRLVETYLTFAPAGLTSFVHSIPLWVKEKILQKVNIEKGLAALGRGRAPPEKILFNFHHHSHAASAFYPSPFPEAAILVMDGVGEWATTTIGVGEGNHIRLLDEIRFPHSLGLLYSAFTYHLGFKINDGEYKVMGLAPYGEPRYADLIREHLIDLKDDGSFRLDQRYFNYCTGLTMTNARFSRLFGSPPRKAGEPLTQHHMDMARSVQAVTEEAMLRLCRYAHRRTGKRNLALAGGVALNCVANGRILREGPFDDIWIQPAAGDAGGALGAALAVCHGMGVPVRADRTDGMRGGYLGPAYSDQEIAAVLGRHGARWREFSEDAMIEKVAGLLADDRVVGWFQGRMEFGPRALGNRSILADPRAPGMQRTLNLKVKYREGFRPFAPAVLARDAARYFDLDRASPYMLLVAPVNAERRRALAPDEAALTGLARLNVARSDIPAVTHVDHSARVQTVSAETNPRFHRLLETFGRNTGCGVLVNTSFNVRDEPIVCTPDDAYRCFMATEIDALAIGNLLLLKEDQ